MPREAVMYLCRLARMMSAASSKASGRLEVSAFSRFLAAFFKCLFIYSAELVSCARLAILWEGIVMELEMLSTLSW